MPLDCSTDSPLILEQLINNNANFAAPRQFHCSAGISATLIHNKYAHEPLFCMQTRSFQTIQYLHYYNLINYLLLLLLLLLICESNENGINDLNAFVLLVYWKQNKV